jgi:pyruvate kinase
MRKTKIVCTMGPSSSDPKVMEALFKAGMNVARINMSHGSHAGHAKVIRDLRRVSKKLGLQLAILLDLQGPKIRVGRMTNDKVELKDGAELILTTKPMLGEPHKVYTSYKHLPKDCKAGDPILLDDGKLRLRVLSVHGTEVRTRVEVGGYLKNNKGMNLPGVALSTPSVTPKDMEDLRFGLQHGVDYVALSFVRRPDDVLRVKKYIASQGKSTPVVAKIEKPEALEHLRAITRASDAIMVARGDLGVELDLDKVPLIQKEIIATAHAERTLVITATQMLESMTEAPSPTRAEVSDVANAILDGTDAVMMSGETAAGKYPIEACQTMAAICESTEASAAYRHANAGRLQSSRGAGRRSVAEAVCFAARAATDELRIKAIVCATKRGKTARYLSKLRPEVPIYAFTPDHDAVRQMGLYWGVKAAYTPKARNTDNLHQVITAGLLKQKKVAKGDLLVMVSGMPIGLRGTINMMKIHEVE